MNNPVLVKATILKRYKRFLCDVILDESGQQITAHCPNSGSMKGIPLQSAPAMLSYNPSPSRVYKYTLEMVHNGNVWIGVNTIATNKIASEAITNGTVKELAQYQTIKHEVKISDKSRIDIVLEDNQSSSCYVEVKNVSLVEDKTAMFPDAVTTRGQKHLMELITLKQKGFRAVMLFIIQREDCINFTPAKLIDPVYSQKFNEALSYGVEAYAYKANVSPEKIVVTDKVDIKPI